MKNNSNCRILAQGVTIPNDTWATGLNNNDLIIGPSGAGKTRGYVKPNILQCNESMVIADTKGSLIHEVGPILREKGYRVLHLNFKDLDGGCGYNPLAYIRFDPKRRRYNEQDIMAVAETLSPVTSTKDPFWEQAGKLYLTTLIAYVLECLPPEEHFLEYVIQLLPELGRTGRFGKLMAELKDLDPQSFAVQTYRLFEGNSEAEKMHSSITGILGEKLNGLNFHGALQMFHGKDPIDFHDLGRRKTAVFLTISDTDRSMDRLVSLFYTQALHQLCDSADKDYPDHRLSVPVRFILDDFATNAYIPDFHNIISVIRSREIYVSVILQSVTQLNALYGPDNAETIINNCDNCLYLGGQDVETARFMSIKANKTMDSILHMGLDESFLFTRGSLPRKVQKFDLKDHPLYPLLPEAPKPIAQTPAPSGEDTREVA